MNIDRFKDIVPDGTVVHAKDDHTLAVTIPADGFEKLIAYSSKKGDWTHKDYREATKPKKKGKKRA